MIIDCRTPTAIEFKSKLGFKQYDSVMTKEQSVLTRIMKIFASEKILLKHSVLSYRIDLYFPKHKLAIEADENDTKKTGMNIKKLKEKNNRKITWL